MGWTVADPIPNQLKLTARDRALILDLLGIQRLRCRYCKEKVYYKNVSIMPAIGNDEKATLVCDLVACMGDYFSELGDEKAADKFKRWRDKRARKGKRKLGRTEKTR